MHKIRCLIVDDEPPALELLKRYAGMIERLEVVAECQSAVKAFDILQEKQLDLMFLDIQMPMLNGVDFIRTLKNPPAVVLTTAYREYALDGHDLNVLDYLLKPIAFDRFLKAVDRFDGKANHTQDIANPDGGVEHIFCKVNKTRHKVVLKDILYIESLKDYVRIHMVKDKLVVKGNIGTFMKELNSNRFARIHRSFAVAIAQVDSFNQTEVHIKEKTLPLGMSYRAEFLRRISL